MGRLKYAPTHRREPTQHKPGFRDEKKKFKTLKR
nr:MAG TPA: hypothetical protein [Caudoviricetes sp.]DAZ06605.1 MAG TPA: hypothetical protein [Caudoviricetes sp.]